MAGDKPAELWSISYSPWSVRVRWALRVLRYPYTEHRYTPPFSTWILRFRLRKWRVTAPVMFAEGQALTDGSDIVEFCDMRRDEGVGSLLDRDGWKDWITLSNEILEMERYVAACVEFLRGERPGACESSRQLSSKVTRQHANLVDVPRARMLSCERSKMFVWCTRVTSIPTLLAL